MGILQIDVVKYRVQAEYGVNVDMKPLPYKAARWVTCKDKGTLENFISTQSQNICRDCHGNPALLLDHDWRLKFHQERNPDLEFHDTAKVG